MAFRAWRHVVGMLAVFAAVPASGQTDGGVRLEDLLAEARQNNPEVLAAQEQLAMARARGPQVGALPDPMLRFEFQNIGLTDFSVGQMDMSMIGFSVAQPVPYPGKRRLRAEVAQQEAERVGAMVDVTRLSIEAQVKLAYYDLAYVYRALEIVAQSRAVLAEVEATAQSQYSVGKGTQQDVWKARVEQSLLVERTAELEQMREGLWATLNRLLNRAPESIPGRPEPLGPPVALPAVDTLFERARAHNPEQAVWRHAVATGETQVALMKKEYKPDLAFSAGWRSRGGLDDLYQVMVEVELPLNRERRRQGVLEAVAGMRSIRQQARATEDAVLAEVRDNAARAQTARRLVLLYENAVIPQATFALESARAGYQVGQVDFLTVLDGVQTLLESELTLYRKRADFHRAVARLENAVGASVVAE